MDTMPDLTFDTNHVSAAWDHAVYEPDQYINELLPSERLDFGRKAVVIHVPVTTPHGAICGGCHHGYPCWILLWGMGLLKHEGWHLSDLFDLMEASAQAGER